MSIKKIKYQFLRTLAKVALDKALALVYRSLRVEIVNAEEVEKLLAANKSFVVAFWHGVMFYPWYYFRNRKMNGLTSQSKDGELLARQLEKWDYNVVRGSSSVGGKVALGIIVDLLKNEGPVAITPDGPRGPARVFKPGAVVAAHRSRTPIVLLGAGYKSKRKLKSWDQFEVPYPFSRVRLVFSSPWSSDAAADRDEITRLIAECETELNALQSDAEKF
jgi:lysophospholipid acyltransferase (LPLAT)-like uncharacterized protein